MAFNLSDDLSLKKVFFDSRMGSGAINDTDFCTPKLVLQVIYIILLIFHVRSTVLSGSYRSGFITLLLIFIWIYINLLYQTKLCNIAGEIGNSIRMHELFYIIMQYMPYIIILCCIYSMGSAALMATSFVGPLTGSVKKGFVTKFKKENNTDPVIETEPVTETELVTETEPVTETATDSES